MAGGYPTYTESGDFQSGHGRRYIGAPDHMQNDGVSAPAALAHGYGRRHLIPEDHQVTRGDVGEVSTEDQRLQQGKGRKLIVPFDHMKCDVLKPLDEITPVKVPSGSDMKEALKDWLLTVHDMVVFDQGKWTSEVNVEPRGCHWVVESMTLQKRSISREGPTAKIMAEKLATMPNSELRYFGLRFAGPNDPRPIRREKHGTFEDNKTMVSPGVQNAISRDGPSACFSSTRKHPEDVQRRYISSGAAHFDSMNVAEGATPGKHGHSKDDYFDDSGLERGIGRGKRHIGAPDHLYGGGALSPER